MKIADWTPPANPSDIAWAMLAAYIDGEGSISIRRRIKRKNQKSPNYVVSVVLTNCDHRMLTWAKSNFPVGTLSLQRKERPRRTVYRLEVQATAAEWLIRGCYPYFQVKREQADIALMLRESMDQRGCTRRQLPAAILQFRQGLKDKLHAIKAEVCDLPQELSHLVVERKIV